MAVSTPLMAGGLGRVKAVLMTAAVGALTLAGALIGMLIGGISDFAVALSLSAAGGAMLYIVFGELIPHAVVMTKNRAATIVTLVGVIVGLGVTLI
jgi:ZIP family zinc transporter